MNLANSMKIPLLKCLVLFSSVIFLSGCGGELSKESTLKEEVNAKEDLEALLMDYAKLEKLSIDLPYIYEYSNDSQSVMIYGSYHTSNPEDSIISDIESKLLDFEPDLILYEGDGIAIEETKEQSIEYYFEMGLVRYMARELNIRDMNLEPSSKERLDYLLKKYSKEEVLLASIGSQIMLLMVGEREEEFEASYNLFVRDLKKEGFPFTGGEMSIQHFYRVYEDFYGIPFAFSTFDYETIEIKFNKTRLNKLNQESARYRDIFMINLIEENLKRHKRIYVQIGGRHAIVWEKAIERMIKNDAILEETNLIEANNGK